MLPLTKLLFPAILLAPTSFAAAQEGTAAPAPIAATASDQETQLAAIETALQGNYVFPANVPAIMEAVRSAAQSSDASERDAFARALTEALIAASGDPHFIVGIEEPGSASTVEYSELSDKAGNYGFQSVRLLAGNIGYLRFDNFSDPDLAFATASAALKLLENSDGLIIDLRYNNGGYNDLGQLIASHFFPADKDTLLVSYYYNEGGKRIERGQWVLSALPGARDSQKPIHILTSTVTFSAAEWMAFSLQQTGRATIIGAQTSGGGHPVDRFALNDGFFIQIPIGEMRGPNGGEFEGVGVTPDLRVASHRALETSHVTMLETLAAQTPSAALDWALVEARAAKAPLSLPASWLRKAAGEYEGRELVFDGEGLSYKWRGRYELRLTPLGEKLFAVEGTDDYRIELLGDDDAITGISRIYSDGERQVFERTQ
ncbi:S41 family peptidase [uncultured Erythrobacter sp.]|uniref:S41 family peptidase n=1 Tax=uncultured Erythrobacter sp. TaxID=263913 RepID=UPI002622D862|nr:S41 family peptidase [uncultured Erythrobacter sp.]